MKVRELTELMVIDILYASSNYWTSLRIGSDGDHARYVCMIVEADAGDLRSPAM